MQQTVLYNCYRRYQNLVYCLRCRRSFIHLDLVADLQTACSTNPNYRFAGNSLRRSLGLSQ
ncbi:hypothetical protein [Nostoc sp. MS1]|uniref:hypothetical protein n=1 Tax=Nostoc sp. MS1 TaxID=2764711 RepID=UPI001CC4DFB3|nr:hypothetical protein [Nostoc sp. MS1]